MHQHFQTEQWLPVPRPVAFAFFADPRNLPPLMPGWQKARIDEVTLAPPPPRPANAPEYSGIVAGSGTRLLITARVAPGVPLRAPWLALIQDFRWNEGFCDVQLKGPFSFWRHCHSVRDATRNGVQGTVVRDAVEFALPLEPLSGPARSLAQSAMQTLFTYRQRQAADLVPRFAATLNGRERKRNGA